MNLAQLKRRAAAHGLAVKCNVLNPVTLAGKFRYGTFPAGGGVMSTGAFNSITRLEKYISELDNVAELNQEHPLVI